MNKSKTGVQKLTESDKQDDDLVRESEPEVDEISDRVSDAEQVQKNDSEQGEQEADQGSSTVSSDEAQDNVGDGPLDVS